MKIQGGPGKPVIMYDCYNVPDCLPPNKTAARAAGKTHSRAGP